MINLSLNTPAGFISPIRYMTEFDRSYQLGGIVWMLLYYPVIFGNFLLCIKIMEYGFENGWGQDFTSLIMFCVMFTCMAIIPLICFLNQSLSRMVVN